MLQIGGIGDAPLERGSLPYLRRRGRVATARGLIAIGVHLGRYKVFQPDVFWFKVPLEQRFGQRIGYLRGIEPVIGREAARLV